MSDLTGSRVRARLQSPPNRKIAKTAAENPAMTVKNRKRRETIRTNPARIRRTTHDVLPCRQAAVFCRRSGDIFSPAAWAICRAQRRNPFPPQKRVSRRAKRDTLFPPPSGGFVPISLMYVKETGTPKENIARGDTPLCKPPHFVRLITTWTKPHKTDFTGDDRLRRSFTAISATMYVRSRQKQKHKPNGVFVFLRGDTAE